MIMIMQSPVSRGVSWGRRSADSRRDIGRQASQRLGQNRSTQAAVVRSVRRSTV